MIQRECIGWMGRTFGHHFRTFELEREEIPPSPESMDKFINADQDLTDILSSFQHTRIRRELRCRRCGTKAEE